MLMVVKDRRIMLLATAVVAAALLRPAPVLGAAAPPEVVSDRCISHGGDIKIPYPFGVEPGFNLTCNHTSQPPMLFLGDGTVPVIDISVPNATVRINGSFAYFPGSDNDTLGLGTKPITARTWSGALGEGGPYTLAGERNKLVAVGCDVQVVFEGDPNHTLSTCAALCEWDSRSHWSFDCFGVACCQANIKTERSSYEFKVVEMNGATGPRMFGLAWIVESDSNFFETMMSWEELPEPLPAALNWRINHTTCHGNASSPACLSSHSFCENSTRLQGALEIQNGHLCRCAQGYQGNPYLPNGCNDINECEYHETYLCYGNCTNTEGNYTCLCPTGFEGNALVPNGCNGVVSHIRVSKMI